MSTVDHSAWEGFAVAEVGAAAVLTGLVFVAVSVNIDKVLGVAGLPGRAGETVVLYLLVFTACSVLLVPGLTTAVLGGWLLAIGLIGWLLLNTIVAVSLRAPSRQPRSWRATRWVIAQVAALPVIVAGALLIAGREGGLNWLVGGALLALLAGTANAWVLLVEIVRDERYRPVQKEPAS